MPDYQQTTTISVPVERAFAFLSDIGNLPRYFPRITRAEPGDGESVQTTAVIDLPDQGRQTVEGEAWFRVLRDEHRLMWGSEGPNDYRGELTISPDRENARVDLRIHAENTYPGIDGSLRETLDRINALLGSESSYGANQ